MEYIYIFDLQHCITDKKLYNKTMNAKVKTIII